MWDVQSLSVCLTVTGVGRAEPVMVSVCDRCGTCRACDGVCL